MKVIKIYKFICLIE